MIGTILALVTGNPLSRFLAKLVGIALAVVTFGLWQRRQGAQGAKAKQAADALKATTKGQEAARKGRAEATADLAKGKTPEEIVRANDAEW